MGRPLVICVGNELRGDDGVAHEVARLLGEVAPGAYTVCVHQLDVALAADVAEASAVIVVDAIRREEPLVAVERVAEDGVEPGAHSATPGGLLGIARTLFGAAPPMWLVAVSGPEMPHAETLSGHAKTAAAEAAAVIAELLGAEPESAEAARTR